MSREEFREEFTKLFTTLAKDFFENVYCLKEKTEVNTKSDILSIKDVADFLGVSRVTVNNWIKKNQINSYKKGNRRYFDRGYIEKFKIANFNFNERLPKHTNTYL